MFENTWASKFVSAVQAANGEVVAHERIPVTAFQEFVAGIDD